MIFLWFRGKWAACLHSVTDMVTPEADDWIFAFGGASWLDELVYKIGRAHV